MLGDRFVAGICNEELQRYLYRRHEETVNEAIPDGLTLDKALKIAYNTESAEQQQKVLKQLDSDVIQNVNQNKAYKPTNKQNSKKHTRDPCYRCGYTNHTQDKCFYKNEKFSFCDKTGHIIRVCKNRQRSIEKQSSTKNKPSQAHKINDVSSDESDEDDIYACNQ